MKWRALGKSLSGPYSVFVLCVLILCSALAVVHLAYLNRTAWTQLQQIRVKTQKLQVRWGRLLIQSSTLMEPARIESIATEKLDMHVPKVGNIKVIE